MSEVTTTTSSEIVEQGLLNQELSLIRPDWQSKSLIARVKRILPVDASSACQRLLNATFHDLRDKILIVGTDIANGVARDNSLPNASTASAIEEYSNYNTVKLAYKIGILEHAEYRRLLRAYEIRKDLEHEDDEYEADMADVIAVFAACIRPVLARDPISILSIEDVKDVIEQQVPALADKHLISDFTNAPDKRQIEILKVLFSIALDDSKLDIVRQNALRILRQLAEVPKRRTMVPIAEAFQQKVGRDPLSDTHMRVATAAGIVPFLRENQQTRYFDRLFDEFESSGFDWRQYSTHSELFDRLDSVGGLQNIPDSCLPKYVKWMVLCYIGVPGNQGHHGQNRPVFFSNPAEPAIPNYFVKSATKVAPILTDLKSDRNLSTARSKKLEIDRRWETLKDVVGLEVARLGLSIDLDLP